MTIAERNNKLKHLITCLKCEASGKCCDDNCSTQYDAGNMSEIIENLEAISKVLEQQLTTNSNIPFLMHKEMDIPISECQKAYDVAIDYLRSQAKMKGKAESEG